MYRIVVKGKQAQGHQNYHKQVAQTKHHHTLLHMINNKKYIIVALWLGYGVHWQARHKILHKQL
jgi:hypothetical protein